MAATPATHFTMNTNLPTGETFSEGDPTMGDSLAAMESPAPTPSMEDCVSLSALQMPDEGEQMQAPAIGDEVNYQVTGRVTRIEGDKAYVQKTSVNGQQVEPDADDMGGPPDGDTDDMAGLMEMAKQQPLV